MGGEWVARMAASTSELSLSGGCSPSLETPPIADLKRADCMGVLDLIKAEGKLTTANRVYADLSQMLRFALKRDIVDRNPLDTITKRDVGGAEAARERVLDADEVKELVRRIPQAKMTPRSATAIWLIFATGCRVSEAMSARWEHVDLVARKWLLPETKNERDHTIHLSDFALHKFKTLAALPRNRDRLGT
jgi:integrase